MADIQREYKRNVAEGKTFLIIAIVFAVVIRGGYFFYFDYSGLKQPDTYLWNRFSFIFEIPLVSLLASAAVTAGMAVLVNHINAEYVFIRRRTLLPTVFIILLFSCSPAFIYITSEYIGILFFIYVINILFASYNTELKPQASFKVSFMLAFGSLFAPALLLYIPIMWVALSIVRCFNFKAFLASLLGVFTLYFSVFSFYLFADKLDMFMAPFTALDLNILKDFTFFHFKPVHWSILGISLIMLVIIISDNYINRHKDKIRNRAYLGTLDFVVVVALLSFVFLNLGTQMHLFIALALGSLLLAHFYALVEQKISIYLFYLFILFYLLICSLPFLSI